jgi:hypothetical protein
MARPVTYKRAQAVLRAYLVDAGWTVRADLLIPWACPPGERSPITGRALPGVDPGRRLWFRPQGIHICTGTRGDTLSLWVDPRDIARRLQGLADQDQAARVFAAWAGRRVSCGGL